MPDAIIRKPKVVIPKADVDKLFKMLPSDEAQKTLSLVDALFVFHASADKKRCAVEIAERLEPLGIRGITLKSLYRKEHVAFRPDEKHPGQEKFDLLAVVDQRLAKRITGQWLALNTEFIEHWHARVLMNKRKVKPAWDNLLIDLTMTFLLAPFDSIIQMPFQVTHSLLEFTTHLVTPLGSEHHHHQPSGQHSTGKSHQTTHSHNTNN